jgi:hypothetical protein
MIKEAHCKEPRVYWLSDRISPAEVIEFFSAVAFQLWHGQIMRLPAMHLTEPVPYPSNLFLIGTMDRARFDWYEDDLLTRTTVIQWPGAGGASTPRWSNTTVTMGTKTGSSGRVFVMYAPLS